MTPDSTQLTVLWQYHFNPLEYLQFAITLLPVALGFIALRIKSLKARVSIAMSAVIAVLIAREMIGTTLSDLRNARKVERGEMMVVEGTVDSFRFSVGHEDESFSLGGVRFGYFPYRQFGGYTTLARDGGVIRNGRYLRLHYLQGTFGPIILKIEGRPTDQKNFEGSSHRPPDHS